MVSSICAFETEKIKQMKKLLLIILLIPVILVLVSLSFYLINDIIKASNRINIEDKFFIEYVESSSSIALRDENVVFLRTVEEAYWNSSFLKVKGEEGCYLIEFAVTKYPEDMISINCDQLSRNLHGKINSYKSLCRFWVASMCFLSFI